jgi:hypothetical protein
MIQLRTLGFTLLATMLLSIACANPSERKSIDIYQAIEIANRAISGKGVDRISVELICARKHELPHNEIVPRKPTTEFEKALAKKLAGRTYWYVCYKTPSAEMGGDYGVFIDSNSGEVVDFYIGR